MDSLTEHVLDLVKGMGFTIVATRIVDGGQGGWRFSATNGDGHSYTAEDSDRYRAACLLAQLVGAELED